MHRVEFSADGLRGIVDEWPFVPAIAVRIGQALGQYIRGQSDQPFVVVGRDTRPSGAKLLHCLTAGLTGQGVDVINLGVMTTPGVAFLARRLSAGLGVVVSASHSPLEYNGIKLMKQNGLRPQREEEIEIESLIHEFIATAHEHTSELGRESDGHHLIELYIHDHVQRCPVSSLEGLRIILDCADGATAQVAGEVFKRLNAEAIPINCAIDGKNINHRCGSEYTQKCPDDLVKAVREREAAYGFSFDGDGDRLIVVDAGGRVFDGHDLLFVLAHYFRSQGLLKGNTVVISYLSNLGLRDALATSGIRTVITSNGDKYLEEAMWGGGYLLGGEPGGNVIINDGHHTAADAVYAALVLSGMLVLSQGVGLAELAAPLRKRPLATNSVKPRSLPTFEEVIALQEEIKDRESALDKDSRILVWESSTEPGVFRVMVEGSYEIDWDLVLRTAEALGEWIRQNFGSSEPDTAMPEADDYDLDI